ncbi:uncharacterized protein ISCGN_007775 [Ixodes scapularis]
MLSTCICTSTAFSVDFILSLGYVWVHQRRNAGVLTPQPDAESPEAPSPAEPTIATKATRLLLPVPGTTGATGTGTVDPVTPLYAPFSRREKKKLFAASLSGPCKDLQVWVQQVNNHLYYCAALGEGNGQLLVSMWMINKHDGHDEPYHECLHQPLPDRAWLAVGTPADEKPRSIVESPQLLKDIQHLLPRSQTYYVEAFNNLLIRFASKSRVFSPEGMEASRDVIAAYYQQLEETIMEDKKVNHVLREMKPQFHDMVEGKTFDSLEELAKAADGLTSEHGAAWRMCPPPQS